MSLCCVDIFKCDGTEEMTHDDINIATQTIIIALLRIFEEPMWDMVIIREKAERLADDALVKVTHACFPY